MTESLRVTLTVEMLSDWVVGSGSGRQGSIDSLVERDAEGLPFVPSTTLRGLWRDAAEQLAFGLDGGARNGAWASLATFLFGSQPAVERRGDEGHKPAASRLSVADARFPAGICTAVADRPHADGTVLNKKAVRDAFIYIKPGVRIEPRSGKAKTDFLRFDEVAIKGAVLNANCSIRLSGQDDDEALVAFALAATRLVERIGGDRRRGLGRCRLSVSSAGPARALPADVDTAVARLASLAPPDVGSGVEKTPTMTTAYAEPARHSGFHVVNLDIELLGRMVIADAVLGNVVTTLDFIPGSLLLAPASELLRELGVAPEAIWPGFACGDIRVLPATPQFANGERGMPMPFVFEQIKTERADAPRWRNRLRVKKGDPSIQYKAERDGYVHVTEDGSPLMLEKIGREVIIRTHNTVEDDRQKPTKEAGGGVYVYEALEVGSRLRSELWIRDGLCTAATLEAALKKVADGVVLHGSVGRAKRAGYGRFAIRPTLGGAPTLPKIEGDSATLYFETDALLPADGLALSPEDFIVAELTAFGTRNIKIQDGDMRTRRLDGWLTRWGLPRPSFVTIAAGSTITIVGNGLGPALASIAVEGIGGRRGEGFGRVRVNDPLVTTDLGTIRKVKKAERTGEATRARADLAAPTGAARSFLKRIEQRAVAGAIRLAAEVAASDGAKRQAALGWRGETPSMSQLGALRTVMNGLRNEGDRQRTITFLKNLQGSDREQRWGGAVANSKLIHQFEDEEAIWRTIEVDDETLLGTAALSTPADLRLADRDLALASFVAAATRAHKRDMEKG